MRVVSRSLGFSIASALALAAGGAHASPVLETVGAQGGGGGLAAAVTGPSAASTYFNPALLDGAEDQLTVGVAAVSEQIGITLDGRRGGDVPLVIGGREVTAADGTPIPNATVPTEWLERGCEEGTRPGECRPPLFSARPRQAAGSSRVTRTYLVLGGVKSIVTDRVTLGAHMLVPLSQLTTAKSFYNDEREALFSNSLHPELYGDRLTAISLALGGAFRVLPELAIGLGASLNLTNGASASTYVQDSTNYDTLLLNSDVGVHVALAPHVGVRWKAAPWLRIAGAVHAAQSLVIETDVGATLPSGAQSTTHRRDVHDYLPWTARVGPEIDVVRSMHSTFSVVAVLKYANWSSYEDRHGQRPSSYGPDLATTDTVTWTAGVRHRYRNVRGFMDLEYAPSPFPEQVGRSNYVDSDRVGLAAGIEASLKPAWTDKTEKAGTLVPGLQLLAHRIAWRHHTKDDARIVDEVPDGAVASGTREAISGSRGLQTNNPGWPGFGAAGWVFGGSVTLRVLF